VNRSQALVLGFFATTFALLLAILTAAPDIYAEGLGLAPGRVHAAEVGLVAGLSVFLGLLSVGVLRRWRWTFWLVVVAFGFGVLRIPVAVLQLTGVSDTTLPRWYVVLQGVIGAVQVVIAVLLLRGWRRAGVWGA
jgi:hypothetical protein